MRYIEDLIDFPIPYWNGFATDAADPNSQYAGIPSIFLEDTYKAPDGTTRKNPLRWAYSYQGKCKSDPKSPYVQRDPILVKGRPEQPGPERSAWDKKINIFNLYHNQIVTAMQQPVFSLPQYNPTDKVTAEAAWTALPAFLEEMPDDDYKVAWITFDGHFEQAHDNFHGWVGGKVGEMADNTYTAFDPIFLSYHCNMDRLFEHYLRSSVDTRVTADFPLRPFINKASDLDYTNPNNWAYTTTGEMARPVAALGYAYAPPSSPDAFELPKPETKIPRPSGGNATKVISVDARSSGFQAAKKLDRGNFKPVILYENVVCTEKSYQVDIFLRGAESLVADPVKNPDFVGRLFRFGMGTPPGGRELRNKNRCLKDSVTRVIDAQNVADKIVQTGWNQTVKELDGSEDGRVMEEQQWKSMLGFEGKLVWVAQ